MPIVEQLAQSKFVCSSITRTQVSRNPQTPYRTSTLQRAAAGRFRFRARRTMDVAQRLYEGIDIGDGTHGLITYMRTDSTRVSAEARAQAADFIKQHHGENYLGKGATAKARKGVQDAHEAIRPTDVTRTPEMMKPFLDNDEARLYELIWRRFVASQMAPAVYSEVAVEIAAGEYGFRASGSVLVFDGWQAVLPQERDETQAQVLGELEEGQTLELVEIRPEQHFTKPPPRYTEATLVRALEENGVGRPSTYAPTIDTLRQRKYVRMQQQAFIPTTLGLVVNDYLVANFPEIVDIDFTASIEERLDTVQSGETQWQEILRARLAPSAGADCWSATHCSASSRAAKSTRSASTPETYSPMCSHSSRTRRLAGSVLSAASHWSIAPTGGASSSSVAPGTLIARTPRPLTPTASRSHRRNRPT